MKRIIIFITLITSIFLITACNDGQYFTNEEIAKINVDDEMKKLEEIHDAVGGFANDMGIDLQLPDLNDYNNNQLPEKPNYNNFTLLPMDVFSIETPGKNKYTGNHYYFLSFAEELTYVNEDGSFYISVVVGDEETNTFDFMMILIPADNKEWSDEYLQNNIKFYIEFVGYSDEEHIRRPYGIYIGHEMMN